MTNFYLPGNYSSHFTRRELCFSERAVRECINNLPDEAAEQNLKRLCLVLEVVREEWGPWKVTSGYRCAALNALTPGSSKMSAHIFGRAADGEPLRPRVKLVQVMDWLAEEVPAVRGMVTKAGVLGIDQAILEYPLGGWIHVGIARPSRKPRGQLLVKLRSDEPCVPYSTWRRKAPAGVTR